MSLAFLAACCGIAAAGAVLGAWLRRRAVPERRPRELPAPDKPDEILIPLGFPVELGDVVSIGTEELWLTGGWLLKEGPQVVAALLFSTDGTLVALPEPRSGLSLVAPTELQLPRRAAAAEPAATLDHDGERFDRRRRRPVTVERLETGPDIPCAEGLLVEYEGAAETELWVLVGTSTSKVRAWTGRRLRSWDRMGGGVELLRS